MITTSLLFHLTLFFSMEFVNLTRYNPIAICVHRAAESLAGARGKFFLGAPISKFFSGKMFSDNSNAPPPPPPTPVDNFLGGKFFTQISCTLSGNISHKKMTGVQQKISRGPPNLGPGAIPPLSASLCVPAKLKRDSQNSIIRSTIVKKLHWQFYCTFNTSISV
jgi:hypothetical protein